MSYRPYIIGALIGAGISIVATKYFNSIDWIDAIGRNFLGSYPFPAGLQAAVFGAGIARCVQSIGRGRFNLEKRVETKH